MVSHGQRVAILSIAELELAFEVGAPGLVRRGAREKRCSAGAPAHPADRLDQAVTVEHGMDRALGRNAHVAIQPPDQELAILRAPQCGLSRLRTTIRLSICCGSWLA